MTDTLAVSVYLWPSHALVIVAGECDITTAPQLLAALARQMAADERLVVVDLSALRYLDLAGIHALLHVRRALVRHGRSLALAAPQPIVARILELAGVGYLIPVYPSVAEALAAHRRA